MSKFLRRSRPAGRARACAPHGGGRPSVVGVNDDAGKYEPGDGAFWTTMAAIGMTLEHDHAALGRDVRRPASTADRGATSSRPALAAAQAAGVSVTLRRLSAALVGARRPGERARSSRPGWRASRRRSRRARVRRHERVQPACSPTRSTPAGRTSRPRSCGAFLAAALRRAQGRRPGDLRLGRRPLAARQPGAEGRLEPARDEPARLAEVPRPVVPRRAAARRR